MRMSLHMETARPTAAHNDRSMYTPDSYPGRDSNTHWDCYGLGSSVEAEARFGEMHFREILDAQNNRAIDMRKTERVMSMAEYMRKHPCKEIIYQLGDRDEHPDSADACVEAADVITQWVTSAGGQVISWDVHMDEATPHLHLRCYFLDETGKPNVNGCLAARGIKPPSPNKKISQKNNRLATVTKCMREDLEDMSKKYVPDLVVTPNKNNAKHTSIKNLKTLRELRRQAAEAKAERDKAADALQSAVEGRQALEKAKHDLEVEIADLKAEKAAEAAEAARLRDQVTEETQRRTDAEAARKAAEAERDKLQAMMKQQRMTIIATDAGGRQIRATHVAEHTLAVVSEAMRTSGLPKAADWVTQRTFDFVRTAVADIADEAVDKGRSAAATATTATANATANATPHRPSAKDLVARIDRELRARGYADYPSL